MLAGCYLANGREIGSYDTIPTALTALTLAQGEGFFLDRFQPLLREADGRVSPYVERVEDHLVSRYPLATAIVAAPLIWPQLAYFDADERAAFNDVSAPIVLVRAHAAHHGGSSTCGLAASINPRLDTVGLMRPTSPLHALLTAAFRRPLVCTSGNRDGDPLEYEVAAAEKRLAGIADIWLHHDREIVRPISDYAQEIRRANPRGVVAVYIPEYVVGRWWEQLLHNQTALRLKGRLLFSPGVMVISVPYQLRSSQIAAARERHNDERVRSGDLRRGNVREGSSNRQVQR